jgi:hypothetical protein
VTLRGANQAEIA